MKDNKNSKFIKITNDIALNLAKQNVNSACIWVFHQPEVPEEANKFKRHK